MLRRIAAVFILLIWLITTLALGEASAASAGIDVLRVKGTINPALAGYIDRGISQAESDNAVVCVIQLDTPGGLYSTTIDIVQRINQSEVPIVVYIFPAGASAASAGAFITMASHVAAMAPNTRIGAAHPVGIGEEMDETMIEKVVNDAVALIRGSAELRGRNADWAESAVRESASITDLEALQLGVIELRASDLGSLIDQLDGREVIILGETKTLHTKGIEPTYIDMTPIESFLFVISDPNIAYILLSLAMTGIFLELANPGAFLPGIVGGICLLLAFYSLGMLPVNYAGVLLIALAFLLFLAEILTPTYGILTVGGVLSFIIGSLILFSSTAPYFSINPWVIAAVVISITASSIFVIIAVFRAHRRRATTGREGLIGKVAVARTSLEPEGLVFVDGERWNAAMEQGKAEPGEEVIVTKVEGMKLWVTRLNK